MKLRDLIKRENELISDMISSLSLVKKDMFSYAEIVSNRFDAELEHIRQTFSRKPLKETIEMDNKDQLYHMIGVIDQWILSLQRMRFEKDDEEKEWFSDKELEKKQVYRLKDPSEKESE